MKIRDHLKKKLDYEEGKSLVQTRQDEDLILQVDAQIEKDKEAGLKVDRTVVIEAGLLRYLEESGKPFKQRKSS